METIELQNQFAARVARAVKSAWGEIRVHYENVPVEGVPREVFTASFLLNGTKHHLELPLEALDLLEQLKKTKPQGQAEEWVWRSAIVHGAGEIAIGP